MRVKISTPFYLLLIAPFIFRVSANAQEKPLFNLVPESQTHIKFMNSLNEDTAHNVLSYEYFYNGGGVATGDINNDGLPDIYFTSNMGENKLYLNLGNFRFKDITKEAGVGGRKGGWKTGVTMVDVNGDGLLDIYVCYSGKGDIDSRRNQLFINLGPDKNGIPHFKEEAKEYGLDDPGYSTQAIFFDMNNDGYLDCYVLNHNVKVFKNLDQPGLKTERDPYAGDHLYENKNGHFVDITEKAGISGNPISFGLGVSVSDINNDGYEDIYVSNDYDERDYLYINNGDGSFTDKYLTEIRHGSYFSMGNDIADMNNDGLPDIMTLDMLPPDNHRQKLLFGPENYFQHEEMVKNGYGQQFMCNGLQLNNGNGSFSEICQLAGVSNTDWSWSPLFADFDNDGWKDLYITNGYARDYTNMDFLKFKSDYIFQQAINKEPVNLYYLVKQMPSSLVHNFLFKNNGDLTFTDESKAWGFGKPILSNGAAYADLDNDGDLDLIVNNLNETASIYRNMTSELLHRHFLKIKFEGARKNRFGLGAKVYVYAGGHMQYYEQMPTRGFQSSVSEVMNIGLGDAAKADSLKLIWPGGKSQILKEVAANQTITLKETDAAEQYVYPRQASATVFSPVKSPLNYTHQEYPFNDFKRQPLMPSFLSTCGPVMAKADVNGDGLEDIYIGGAKGNAGKLFIRQKDGSFSPSGEALFKQDEASTDGAAVFFDANGDGYPDLYVASGGYEDYQPDDLALQDRLYLNDGKGNFTKARNALPPMPASKSCVKEADFNGDGYPDLFVGSRVIPGKYPVAPQSYLLENDGKGHFTDVTAKMAPMLLNLGMVTDAAWVDLNGDKQPDLIIVGEFMPVTVLINKGDHFENETSRYFDKPYSGFWNKILVDDFNHDGHPDLVIGNYGTNSQLKASDQEPVTMVYKDFDNNGSVDPILCCYIQGKSYPYLSRDELLDQMYFLRQRFTTYQSYADATIHDIFTKKELEGAATLFANDLKTTYFQWENGKFIERPLPAEAQFAPIYSMTSIDYDGDGNKDLLLFGNNSHVRIRLGRYDANYGMLFKGDGKGNFTYVPQTASGLKVIGDVRSLEKIKAGDRQVLLIGINNQPVEAYKLNEK